MANTANGKTPNDSAGKATDDSTGWMSDVQRALALMIVGSFAISTLLATIRVVFFDASPAVLDMTKTLQQSLQNMALIALGFFFGNTMAKMQQDRGQQQVVDKLTSAPPQGPVAPVPSPVVAPAPVVVVSWWSLLTDDEKAAITIATATDSRVQVFLNAAPAGRATIEDMQYLLSKNLLTKERFDLLTQDRSAAVAAKT